MKDFKPSPFDFQPPNFSSIALMGFCIVLEIAMGTMLMSVYAESIGLMSQAYLLELPIIGPAFAALDPDVTTNDLIALLLAVFSLGTPIFLWSSVFSQKILDDPQEWISHPNNKILAVLAGFVVLLVIALEATALYTLISRDAISMHTAFVAQQPTSGLMKLLSQDKGMGIDVSLIVVVINFVLALLTVRTFKRFKSV